MPDEILTLTVPREARGQRLDRWLATQLPQRSRSEIQRWIKAGQVTVDGTVAKPSLALEPGQTVVVELPQEAEESELTPEAIPLRVVYEDRDIAVIDKPAGMVVHPAPGHAQGTLVHALLHRFPDIQGVGGEKRPGIVHRLDKDTSGLMVVAKNDRAHRFLQEQFASRTVYKEYLALVEGRLKPERGRIVAPIGRHPTQRQRMAVLPPNPRTGRSRGREAVTEYQVIGVYTARLPGGVAHFSLVKVVLHTGRTHQIRVHFAWLRHPIVGDPIYGPKRQRLQVPRLFLHAHKLRFRLPSTGEEREFVSPLPPELQEVLDRLEKAGGV